MEHTNAVVSRFDLEASIDVCERHFGSIDDTFARELALALSTDTEHPEGLSFGALECATKIFEVLRIQPQSIQESICGVLYGFVYEYVYRSDGCHAKEAFVDQTLNYLATLLSGKKIV